ncbi:kynurenine/alpha-aminoadipate aminotransferase, mitochondrial-like [Gigantopelta aegis]|uniref:kynurenine/alpha-aminoadipate aminotransferase, mitochondrial-like n=1 Tax=Gigantopelta aegis TaxID=1735272 RepID=UPI001B88C5D8|nr:kynurenine/alpha-aminoadipate aminotransferase, mitochondrial-like [Gigantopelta aegis]
MDWIKMNYSRFLNVTSLGRKPSPIRVLTEIVLNSPKTLISMAGGMPNPDFFPIQDISLTLKDGSKLNIDTSLVTRAMQYSSSSGFPELINWVKDLQERVHKPPTLGITDENKKLDIIITNGSQDGICKTLEACVSAGDNVLIEVPTYAGTLAILNPLQPKILEIESDKDGIIPGSLLRYLSKWKPEDSKKPNCSIPRILYCVPNGGNPTGSQLTWERKKEIYKLCQDYDILIMEDDPYFYLQFSKPYVPSFLSMDEDGRVMRFDSFSKIISSGMRIGCLSGPRALVNKIIQHQQVSAVHSSGLSQVVLFSVLQEMGHDGFLQHCDKVADFYKRQRDACLAMANKHLSGLAEWFEPSGGMFLWLKFPQIKDTFKLISEKARAKEVLFVPGNAFMVDSSLPCQYLRSSFSLVSSEDMDKAFERLSALIKEELNQ